MKEAILYQKLKDNQVRCLVCNHRCVIGPNQRGVCGTRENQKGILYSLVYGQAVSEAIDPVEKKPLFHFLPGTFTYSFATVGCNFRCRWCQNWQISQQPKPQNPILGYDLPPSTIVERAQASHCPSISYTYTEPTIFLEYALETMKLAHKNRLKNIWVSNGYMSRKTLELILPYLDAANIDLKSFSEKTYQEYCGARLKPILENLIQIKKAGVHLEVTTLVIPRVNDSERELAQIAQFIANELGKDIPWHISRFFPAFLMEDSPITSKETLKKAEAIGKKHQLKYVYLGNI